MTGQNGVFELVSADGRDASHPRMSIDISSSRMVPSQTDGHSSQEFILEGTNITKTVVIEMKTEDRR
jgi:hypothetical protein